MSSRAKIAFFPQLGTENYPMNKITIVEKYSKWVMSTDNFARDGYINTDIQTNISTINSDYFVKFKPINGYKFLSVHKTNYDGSSNSGEIAIETDGSVIVRPWNNGTATVINNYLYFDLVANVETRYSVTQNLEHCISDNKIDYKENENVTINLSCDVDYIFDIKPTIIVTGSETLQFNVSDDKKTATLSFVITGNIIITADATHTPYKLTTTLDHCICNYSQSIPQGKTTIIITTDTGYVFNGYISVKHMYTTNTYDNFTNDNTICNITLDIASDVIIKAQAVKKQEQLSSFTNLYRVTNDILTSLSKVRFYTSESGVGDYGSFINNLIKIPFKLNDEMIADTGSIQLGNYDSKVQAELIQNYVLCVNIGHITVLEKYKNVYDYKDTNCILHLPYCENIVLETEYVINRTISIEYKIDLYSGKCTVNVISDFTNEIVSSRTFNIAKKIPFMQVQSNNIVSSLENVIDNGVKTAFIEVVRNIPYNVNSVFGKETIDFGILENYVGYIKVSDILLNISATNDEKNEIENLLKNGVFINEIVI